MTKKEYDNVKIGDKIKIKENDRIVTIGDILYSPFFKYQSRGKDGFMIGNCWYPYEWCEVVK